MKPNTPKIHSFIQIINTRLNKLTSSGMYNVFSMIPIVDQTCQICRSTTIRQLTNKF